MPNVQNLGHRLNKNKILRTVSGCCKYKDNHDVLAGFLLSSFFPYVCGRQAVPVMSEKCWTILNQYLCCHVDMSSTNNKPKHHIRIR